MTKPDDTGSAGRLISESLATFAARVFSGGFRYALHIAIARLAGAASLGEFSVGNALLLVLVTVAAGGAVTGLVRHGAARIASEGRGAAGVLIRRQRTRTLSFSIGLSLLWLAAGKLFPAMLGPAASGPTFFGVAAALPLLAAANVLEAGTRSLGTARWELLLRCALQPLAFLVLLVTGRLALPGLSPLALVWGGYAISLLIEVVGAEALVGRLFPRSEAGAPMPAPGFGGHFVYEILVVAASGADLWLVGLLGGAGLAGGYSAALRTAEIVLVLRASFQALLVPAFAYRLGRGGEGDPGEAAGMAARVGQTAMLAAAAIGVPLAIGSADLLSLFGSGLAAASGALRILVAVPVATAFLLPASGWLLARSPETLARLLLVDAFVTLTAIAILWPSFGLTGAAAGAGLGAIVAALLGLRSATGIRGALMSPRCWLAPGAATVAAVAVTVAVRPLVVGFHPVVRLALLFVVSAAALGGAAVALPGTRRAVSWIWRRARVAPV